MVNSKSKCFWKDGKKEGEEMLVAQKWSTLRASVFGRMEKRRVRRCGGTKMVNSRERIFGRMGKRRVRRCGGTKMVNSRERIFEKWDLHLRRDAYLVSKK
jgi:hypothetical protein